MDRKSLATLVAFTAVLLALLPSRTQAQLIPEFGVKGGLSLATMRGGLKGSANLLSFGAGGFVNFPLPHGLGIQPEVLYVVKGASYGSSPGTDPSGNPTGDITTLLPIDYVEIPVLLRWKAPSPGLVHPNIVVGPAFDFMLRARLKTTGSLETSGKFDGIKSTDVGIAMGAGASFGHGRRQLTLEGRYTVGLLDVVEKTVADPSKNGNLLVMAGVSF